MVYLGIDGGGSKTAFLLEDDTGQLLSRAETGPSNWISAGKEEAKRNITAGIQQLKTIPDVVGSGFAGAGRPEGVQFFKDCLAALLPKAQIFVETDAFISYVGAIGMEPGVLLIAGTGSIAIGRRRNGSMIRVGGWGPIFGDEGSGFWIGREAIQTALRFNDSDSDGTAGVSEFVTSVCRTLQLDTITNVSAAWKSGTLTVRSVASLAKLLFDEYPAEPANRILDQAAKHLCAMVDAALTRIGNPDCRLSITGSVGSHPRMKQLLGKQGSGHEFETPRQLPERGAIIWARSLVKC